MSPPNTNTPGKKEDPRLWWLPMPVLVLATAAAFYAGVQLANLNSTVSSMREDMRTFITVGQFKDWTYKTERINAGMSWSAAEIPPRDRE